MPLYPHIAPPEQGPWAPLVKAWAGWEKLKLSRGTQLHSRCQDKAQGTRSSPGKTFASENLAA